MAQAVQQKPAQNGVFTEEEMNNLSKKYYGLSDKDVEELSVFINEFDDACKDIPENAGYDDLKAIVDAGNKIPSQIDTEMINITILSLVYTIHTLNFLKKTLKAQKPQIFMKHWLVWFCLHHIKH